MPDEHDTEPGEPLGEIESSGTGTAPSVSEEPVSLLRWLTELVVLVGLAFILAQGVKTFVVQPFIIPSGSMQTTLEIGDRVLVSKFAYRLQPPRPGDVVVFRAPGGSDLDYIKRVVAIEGQTVDVVDGRLEVDGRTIDEDYAVAPTLPGSRDLPLRVPAGHVFLMGDNRGNSTDSRWFGPQPVSRVRGKAFVIFWPPRDAAAL